MRIEKNTYDKSFPFTIEDGWGGKVHCSLDDLEDLAFEIERVLKEERADVQSSVTVIRAKDLDEFFI